MLVIDSSNVIVENQLKCFWCSRKHVVSSESKTYINSKVTELKIVNFLTKVGPLMV